MAFFHSLICGIFQMNISENFLIMPKERFDFFLAHQNGSTETVQMSHNFPVMLCYRKKNRQMKSGLND